PGAVFGAPYPAYGLRAGRVLGPAPLMGSGAASLTVGVAITVPDPWGEELQELRASFGDRLAWTVPTHITLLPPTQVSSHRLSVVDDHLRQLVQTTEGFEVTLAGTDTFRPVSQTSFVAVTEGAERCAQLADRVRSGPLRRSLLFPYHPHVTIAVELADEAHDVAERRLAEFALRFDVSQIERYELAEHGVWESVREFGLAGRHG
ncbi:MAG: 2'-5' RNA ligase family protein, partial [Actinomycetes bacterium]